jgi:hypothetical protein
MMFCRLLPIQLCILLGPGVGAFSAENREIDAVPNFKQVRVFTRDALFVGKDTELWALRTTNKGRPKAIFTISKSTILNSEIGVSEKGEALFVSDGQTIFRVTAAGDSKKALTLTTLPAEDLGKDVPSRFQVNWYLAAGPGDVLYFDLLPNSKARNEPRRSYTCRYDPARNSAYFLELHFPTGIDVDCRRAIVYAPPLAHSSPAGPRNAVFVSDFSGMHARRLAVTHNYHSCALSADGKTLLLSESDLEKRPHIATLDIATGRETVLDFSGAYAVWGEGDSIYFVRGETTLWSATIAAKQPTRLLQAVGQPASDRGKGSYAERPVVSRDGSWLAWRWALKGWFGSVRDGTVLVDLKNHEYRLLDRTWTNINWAR